MIYHEIWAISSHLTIFFWGPKNPFRYISEMPSKQRNHDFCREMYGAPAKICSGPENRDASILFCKLVANAMIFATVFDRTVLLYKF